MAQPAAVRIKDQPAAIRSDRRVVEIQLIVVARGGELLHTPAGLRIDRPAPLGWEDGANGHGGARRRYSGPQRRCGICRWGHTRPAAFESPPGAHSRPAPAPGT